MNNLNFSRQLKDIQVQAENITKGKPSVADIENFSKYSEELKSLLWTNVEMPFVRNLIRGIPYVESSKSQLKNGILSSMFNIFGFLYQEDKYIQRCKFTVETIRGKYASIEFVMKNNE